MDKIARNETTIRETGYVEYRGYRVYRKRDFGRLGNWNEDGTPKGYVITDGICNVMPGATWSKTLDGAINLVDNLITTAERADGNSDVFWYITHKRLGKNVDHYLKIPAVSAYIEKYES